MTIKRDATAPTINATVSPEKPASGWYNIASGAPTVSFTCSDGMSGLAGVCPNPLTFGAGEDLSHSETIYDNAGNSASAGESDIDVDLTAPSITWFDLPATSFYFVFPPNSIQPRCDATDALSGLDGTCGVTDYSAAVGKHKLTATAYDKAGNKAEDKYDYEVLAWTYGGFFSPVDMPTVVNTVKAGSTVPLKFEVFVDKEMTTELTDVSIVKGILAKTVSCSPNDLDDPIEVTATGGTALRYDFTSGQFIYNWKTPKTIGCLSLTVTLQDATTITASFKVK